ncbi:hypothetical protein [Streptomyces sp. NBC_00091]|uniref:hypothetical protein n=1 Tax=Streptomyces sp. NBC_00091 TaxID=2975648 RepID=UPI00225535A1|nr:hypothetical protein [Streptomyces sp. NBC_00091]MCX5379060.1 hypothetical protein [Streptomyces sp. NBC_00091]
MTTRAVHVTNATQPSAPQLGTARRILRVAGLAATLPYLTLKAAWVAGSHVGIPAGSVLLEHEAFFAVANAVTLAMDATVILIVLVLTQPWGMRVPGWLLTVPVFVASGLLAPIVMGFPAQLVAKALGAEVGEAAEAAQASFLDPWVFTVVYGGFIIQAIALAGLFVPYARERWGGRWRGPLGQRLPSPTGVGAGVAAAAGVAVGGVCLYWAFGGSAGLPAQRVAQYSVDTGLVSGAHAICALGAGAGALLLARGGERRAGWPLALTWIGSGAALSWGAWMLLASLLGPDTGVADQPTAATLLTYAGQMITGLLAAAVLARYLHSRREC